MNSKSMLIWSLPTISHFSILADYFNDCSSQNPINHLMHKPFWVRARDKYDENLGLALFGITHTSMYRVIPPKNGCYSMYIAQHDEYLYWSELCPIGTYDSASKSIPLNLTVKTLFPVTHQ